MPGSFFIADALPAQAESGTYQPLLVLLSYIVASFASYTALALARSLHAETDARKRRLIHWSGAFMLGAGIWSMHFIAVLAYKPRVAVTHTPWLTLLPLAPAVATSYGVLYWVSRDSLSRRQLATSALVLGAGIATMHYIGMAAMHMDADLR